MNYEIQSAKSFKGTIKVPGDKSISHRSIMFGAISNGLTQVDGFLDGADCRSTISCFRSLGIPIEQTGNHVLVHGKGLHGLKPQNTNLDAGNSGTTVRLMSGILAGQPFRTEITGDASIQKRPMGRIIKPLSQMGAQIRSLSGDEKCPLVISPSKLSGIHYESPVASAQVKSCILLAGLYAEGKTSVTEPILSRNHTELMLSSFGADITSEGTTATIDPEPDLYGQQITVPGDISSAAYFIAAGLICPNADLMIENVNINPTRAGILKVALDMGGDITILNKRTVSGEEVCDLNVRSSSLHGIEVSGEIIPTLIDELPVIACMAAFADGTTVIRDAAELKVKESDRIALVSENLSAMGAAITPTEDGFIIHGGKPLHGIQVKTADDHRIAMSFAIAGLAADGVTTFDHPECVVISYPNFYQDLMQLKDH